MKEIIVVIGSGAIGQAVARRVGTGKHIILADLNLDYAKSVSMHFRNAGFANSEAQVDVTSRQSVAALVKSATELGTLSEDHNRALATTRVEDLLKLPFLQSDQIKDSLHAYQLSKRGNALRVMAEAVRWGKCGARINTISPGIIITPLAQDELSGPRGDGYRRMIELSPAGRAGTADEVAQLAGLLMGPDGGFITGSDFLMDGGVTSAYWYGDLAPKAI